MQMANLPEPESLPFEVKAIFNYRSRNDNELTIEEGKLYTVTATDGKGIWWNTQDANGKEGWFPANYVEVLGGVRSSIPPTSIPPTNKSTTPRNPNTTAWNTSVITYEKINEFPPVPAKTILDKEKSPSSLLVQVIGARNLKVESNAFIWCEIYIYHQINDKGKDGRLVHKTTKLKSPVPEWINEKYEVSVKDPEIENVRVIVMATSKKLGEVILPLRATIRQEFSIPNFEYRYYKLNNGEGDILMWHQFYDSRQSFTPLNVKHQAHIGVNSITERHLRAHSQTVQPVTPRTLIGNKHRSHSLSENSTETSIPVPIHQLIVSLPENTGNIQSPKVHTPTNVAKRVPAVHSVINMAAVLRGGRGPPVSPVVSNTTFLPAVPSLPKSPTPKPIRPLPTPKDSNIQLQTPIQVTMKQDQQSSISIKPPSTPPPPLPISDENYRLMENSENDVIMKTSLAQLVLLRNETPLSFEEAVATAYNNELDNIAFDSNIPYGEHIYNTLSSSEKEYGLTRNEVLAIFFYTLEWVPKSFNLYSRLNRDLTSRERENSVPKWRHYLYYLFNGLRKLPKWHGRQDIYRGINQNLVKNYPKKYYKGAEITLYGFTSTTTNMERVTSFVGNTEGTIFSINECFSGRSINTFSGHPDESEVLIPCGSRFLIISIVALGNTTMIQMKQIPTFEKLLRMEESDT